MISKNLEDLEELGAKLNEIISSLKKKSDDLEEQLILTKDIENTYLKTAPSDKASSEISGLKQELVKEDSQNNLDEKQME